MKQRDSSRYDDIIGLPHHQSPNRPHMPVIDRAAQFSPFAALTGYEQVITETARLTDQRIELDEDAKFAIDQNLQLLAAHIQEHPEVSVTYFRPDQKKEGGAYVTVTGAVKRIDVYERIILMENGIKLPINDITAVDGELFQEQT